MSKKGKKLTKQKLIHQGKYTEVYGLEDETMALVEFNDEMVSLDSKKKVLVRNKKEASCSIAQWFFEYLKKYNVPNYFLEKHSEHAILVQKAEYVPVQVVIRNMVSASLAKRFGLKEGELLEQPVLEYLYDHEKLGYPPLNNYHIYALKLATKEELNQINDLAFKVNAVVRPFMARRGWNLADCELEFGKVNGQYTLAGPISIENCSLTGVADGRVFDREVLKMDPKEIRLLYDEVLKKING